MFAILSILVGVVDMASMLLAAGKYWRISLGLCTAATAIVITCAFTDSPTVRWLIGFHIVVLIIMGAIVWEQKRGKLKD